MRLRGTPNCCSMASVIRSNSSRSRRSSSRLLLAGTEEAGNAADEPADRSTNGSTDGKALHRASGRTLDRYAVPPAKGVFQI